MIEHCIQAANDGILIALDATPNSGEARFPAGVNDWRRSIKITITAPPEGGKANREICALIAGFFSIDAARVSIVAGGTGRRKTVRIGAMTRDEALDALQAWEQQHA